MSAKRSETYRLLAAVVALALLDASISWLSARHPPAEPLSLQPFDPALAKRIQIGQIDDLLAISRGDDGSWSIAGAGLSADPREIELILSEIADGISASLSSEVTPEQLGDYGLAGGAEIRVNIEGDSGPLAELYVGADAGGGNTWVRLPGEDRVFQARIGGRARYERSTSSLRDRRLSDLDPASVETIEIASPSARLLARRAADRWQSEPFPADDAMLEELVRALSRLRAVEMSDQSDGIDWSLATVHLEAQGERVELQFGRTETNRYVRRPDHTGVGQIRLPWVDKLGDPSIFADKSLWAARRIERFSLLAPGRDGLLEREGDRYVIRRPSGVDIDPNHLSAVISFLMRPKVLSWGSGAGESLGERPSAHRWSVETDQGTFTLEIGEPDGDRVAVRADQRAGWLDARVIRSIEDLFGG